MERITWADQRKIAEFVRHLYGLNSVKAISERILQRIDTLIGSNSASVAWYDSKTFAPKMLVENVGPEYQTLLPVAWALRHEHPGIRYHHVHRGRAVAIADLVPIYQWKKTGLYNEVTARSMQMVQKCQGLAFWAKVFPGICSGSGWLCSSKLWRPEFSPAAAKSAVPKP